MVGIFQAGMISTRALELKESVILADIVAFRGSVEYEPHRIYWIMGKLHTKNEGPKSRY